MSLSNEHNTTYLVTGANRGIGFGIVAKYLSRPNTTVVAAVRNPSGNVEALNRLPKGDSSSLIIVKIDSASKTDAQEAVKLLQSKHSLTSLDTVIANAGICYPEAYGPVAGIRPEDISEHVEVNAIGPLVLFQAVLPLLQKSKQPGKFFATSSAAASIGGMQPFPMTPYGISKAALNYILRKIHFDHENLIAFAVDPGYVATDMGNIGSKALGMQEKGIHVDESTGGIVKVIDNATREKTSGHFLTYEGREFPW